MKYLIFPGSNLDPYWLYRRATDSCADTEALRPIGAWMSHKDIIKYAHELHEISVEEIIESTIWKDRPDYFSLILREII